MKNCIRRLDFLLQSHFRLSREVFAENADRAASPGIPGAAEWSRNRQRLTAPFGEGGNRYESDESYRNYLHSIHDSKILAVLSLMEQFDFSRFGRILELGCGDMPQAHTVCSRHPGLSYTATDFDAGVIEQCSRLPMLQGIRKSVLDVVRSDLEIFAAHDLIVSWSLEFSLDDAQMTRMFEVCRRHRVPYLLCTHTTAGPLFPPPASGAAAERRLLGWLRSVAEIDRLAARGGMRLERKDWHVNHAALFFSPQRS